MKVQLFLLTLILFTAFAGTGCEEIKSYPNTPDIDFSRFNYDDTILIFEFVDGDGNIGLDPPDTSPPYDLENKYYHNLFLTILEKEDGVFNPMEIEDSTFYRIPRIPEPTGQNKVTRGDIELDMSIYGLWPDTFQFRFYIVDRDLNHSDTIVSPELTFSEASL